MKTQNALNFAERTQRDFSEKAFAMASGASPDELMSRDYIDRKYGQSDGRLKRKLELAAMRGDGPPMIKLSWRMVRYRRRDFEAWLDSLTVRSTCECSTQKAAQR